MQGWYGGTVRGREEDLNFSDFVPDFFRVCIRDMTFTSVLSLFPGYSVFPIYYSLPWVQYPQHISLRNSSLLSIFFFRWNKFRAGTFLSSGIKSQNCTRSNSFSLETRSLLGRKSWRVSPLPLATYSWEPNGFHLFSVKLQLFLLGFLLIHNRHNRNFGCKQFFMCLSLSSVSFW